LRFGFVLFFVIIPIYAEAQKPPQANTVYLDGKSLPLDTEAIKFLRSRFEPICDFALFLGSTVNTDLEQYEERASPIKLDPFLVMYFRYSLSSILSEKNKSIALEAKAIRFNASSDGKNNGFIIENSTLYCINFSKN
jgi:hypothetical protein